MVRELVKSFPTAAGPLRILDGVQLDVAMGRSAAIVGPSGSGKSTLLYLIGTLDVADSGSITLRDREITQLPADQLAAFRNENIGFIFQEHHLLPQLSVLENVLVPVVAQRGVTTADREHAMGLIESVGLSDRISHRPGQLSGGQRERVAIARALIMQPKLVLADEPTGNLDRRTAETIRDLLVALPKEHGTILVTVTHSSDLAAAMDDRYELLDGKLV